MGNNACCQADGGASNKQLESAVMRDNQRRGGESRLVHDIKLARENKVLNQRNLSAMLTQSPFTGSTEQQLGPTRRKRTIRTKKD